MRAAEFEGIEARAVDVQVQVAPGLPAFAVIDRRATTLLNAASLINRIARQS